jgi:hypothetical protein
LVIYLFNIYYLRSLATPGGPGWQLPHDEAAGALRRAGLVI